MIKKDKSKNEKYVEKWFKENGFECKLIKQYQSKTKYEISKDGITETFELPYGVEDCKKYMKIYNDNFEMKKEINRMKEQLGME